jgi:Family of unknown function (DUF5706)
MTEQTVELVPAPVPPVPAAVGTPAPDAPKKDKEKKKKKKEQNRGVETMFRVTYSNHIALSRLADSKTSMLISINSLIISGVIALVTRTGTVSWHFTPVLVLLAGCLVSLACAVTAARPRVQRSHVDVDDVRNNTGNLLFFAQFTSMSLPQFQESVHALMKDPPLLYDHLARQLYHMGESLNRKYRYLQIAYSAFLVGIGVATVFLAFIYLTGGLDAPAP